MPNASLANLLKQHQDTVRIASDEVQHHQFRTGLIGLNYAISKYGSIPGGSIIQLIGEPKHGKSTLATDIVAQSQRGGVKEVEIPNGKTTRKVNALWVDFEHSFDSNYAKTIGIDLDKLMIVESRYGEEAFEIVEAFLAEGLQIVVIDSIPMFEPKSEEDKSLTDPEKMSSSANPLTRIMKRMLHLVSNADALMILINQYRANISTMSRKEKKPFGARIVQYVSRLTLELVRVKNEDDRTTVVVTLEKNKLGSEARQVPFDIEFGKGIDYSQHVLALAEELQVVVKSGAWYMYEDKKVQGARKAIQEFDMKAITEKVEKLLVSKL